ncbi:unnamed protein product [Lactuca saligna]|uniref:BHLH domain-containing protein n=1 Tax=Lactuca saligna TaxID=75948 RepID=A0AA35Z6S3_LACSI|nr:unnamed protein product [Lactuca saligna]
MSKRVNLVQSSSPIMELPQFKSLSQSTGMEDSFFNFQWPVNSIDNQLSSMATFGEKKTHDHHLHAHAPFFDVESSSTPIKELKNHSNHLPSSQFGNQNYYVFNQDFQGNNDGGAKMSSTSNNTRVTPYQDHVLTERKRREKLRQHFIALSAILPNLKRMDKASVLGDAIEYTKILQEKVKILEEQTQNKANIQSVKFEVVVDGGEISSSEKISGVPEKLPEVEARFSGKNVLIRVHCEKKTGVVENTLAEIEKLHLSVICSNAMIFANSALHITIIAQMDRDLIITMEELVKKLRFGFKKFM